MTSSLFQNFKVTSFLEPESTFLEPEFKQCLQKIMSKNIQIISALSKPSTTKKKKKHEEKLYLPLSSSLYSLFLLPPPPTQLLCSCFSFRICPLWIKHISLAVLFTYGCKIHWPVTLSDPAQSPTISSKYHHSPGKREYKTRNNSRCCICGSGTGWGSVDDSVTVLLIWFLVLDFFIGEDVRQHKFLSSGPHDNEIYTLLLFLACFVKRDAQLLIMLENSFRVC